MIEEKPQIGKEVRLVPWWAIGLAVALLVGIQVLMHVVMFPREPHPPPFVLRLFVGFMAGTVLAFFVLLVGYVNRDAKRRGMNVALWTLLVIFVPNAIGFIIYFLLRQPLMTKCPQCGAMANPSFNYCSKCKYRLRPTCPQCKREVHADDKYCPYCARELAEPAA
jgi:hypothetical protein